MKVSELKEKFESTCQNFRDNLTQLSYKYHKPILTIYEWWCEYSKNCDMYGQSALLSEFEQWYEEKLSA